MTTTESSFTRERIEEMLAAFENRDAETASEFWAKDGVFIDPHYPEPEYRGPEEIRQALEGVLETTIERPGLTIREVWKDNETFAVEVDTHHTMKDGSDVDYPQVFIIESEDGLVTRWQSYLPFPPPVDE